MTERATSADIQLLGELADMARAKGLTSIDVAGWARMELAPIEPPPMKDSKPIAPERCACGHELHQHNNGLCLLGCEPDKCIGEVKT